MAFKFFTIPILGSEQAEDELNAFLRSHKVLTFERRWVDQGPSSFWSFCVDYVDPAAGGGSSVARPPAQRGKVDYREKLATPDFDMFSKLRELRKEISQAEGIPLYAVFKNDQLSEMVERKARTKADLEAIAGVGDARIDKYGARFLELLTLDS